MRIFAVFDVKAEVFNSPFFMRTVGEACRGFTQAVMDPESMMSKWPDDYVLYELGEFDQLTGRVAPREAPYRLMTGFEAKPGPAAVKAVL